MAKKHNDTILNLMMDTIQGTKNKRQKIVEYKPQKVKAPTQKVKAPTQKSFAKASTKRLEKASRRASLKAPKKKTKNVFEPIESRVSNDYSREARKAYSKDKDAFGAGFNSGVANALIPFSGNIGKEAKKKHQNNTYYKVGNVAGSVLATMATLGVGGSSKAIEKAGTKLATSKLGKKATQKLLTSKGTRKIAEKQLKIAGKELTDKAVKAETKKVAEGIIKGASKDLALDATAGTYLNNNFAVNDGKKMGSKEWAKDMAVNSALDIGIGGAMYAAPVVKNTIKAADDARAVKLGTKGELVLTKKKPTEMLPANKKLNVKAPKSVKEYKAELPKTYKVSKDTSKRALEDKAVIKRAKFSDAKTAVDGDLYNAYLLRNEELVKKINKLYGEHLNSFEDIIRNYEPKGVIHDFHPNYRDELNPERGWFVRTSQNDPWYRKYYEKYGRRPPKKDSRKIAEELLDDELRHIAYGGENNGEFGVSDELEALVREQANVENLVQNMDKVDFNEPVFTSKDTPEIGDIWGDVPIPEPTKSRLKTVSEEPRLEPIPKELEGGRNATGARVMPFNTEDFNVKKYGETNGIPNATAYGETTKGVQTMAGGYIHDETSKQRLLEDVLSGDYTKATVPNDVVVSNAKEMVDNDLAKTYADFVTKVSSGKQATSQDIAVAEELVTKLQDLRSTATKEGNLDASDELQEMIDRVSRDCCTIAGEAGRTLQAMRLFNTLSPAGREYSVKKSLEKIKDVTGVDNIKVDTKLMDNVLNATDGKGLAKAKKELMLDVWNQIPPTWTQKANAWRYLAMLGNPKTHIRNVLGNAIFVPIKGMRNVLATGLEKAVVKEGNRTKAILTPNDKWLTEMGAEDFREVKDWLSGGSKYIDGVRDYEAKQFKSATLNKLDQLNTNALEKEDEWFMGFAYKRAYAQYLKANGAKASKKIPKELLESARRYAADEALNSTYRDVSALADCIGEIKKYANMDLNAIPTKAYDDPKLVRRAQLVKKAAGIGVEATIPFTKTPINILRRGADYSPIGIVKSFFNIANAKGNQKELVKAIENFSSGLTGTAIVAAGYYAGKSGLAQGSIDVTSDEGKYKQMMGEQEYSIRIGDYTYTMDWAVPSAMAFFVGANLANDTEEVGLEKALDVISQISDPVFNLSMLSGINTVLGDTAASFKSTNSAVQTVENAIKSYLGQYIPTLSGQIARTVTPYRKSATSTEETAFGRQMHSFLNQQENKIPFLNNRNADYVDNWGNRKPTEWNGLTDNPIMQNFISPGYMNKINSSDGDAEIERLGKELPKGEFGSIVPKYTSSQDFEQIFKKESYRMSEKQLQRFKTTRGTESKILLRELFSSEGYENMTADEKKDAISKCYSQAKEKAIREFLSENGISERQYVRSKLSKNQKAGFDKSKMSVETYDRLRSVKNSLPSDASDTEKAYALRKEGANTKAKLQAMGITVSDHRMGTIKNLGSNISLREYDKAMKYRAQDENGRLSRDEIIAYLENTDMSQSEKRYMYNALASWRNAWKRNPY